VSAFYRLVLSYRGGAFGGWQRQTNARTVQATVEEALGRLLGAPLRIHGASRTDAGVHARGQSASFELPAPFPERGLVHGTNHHLPDDVRVLAAHAMPEGFHARKHAAGKEYSYRLSRAAVLSPLDAPFAVQVPKEIDPARMAQAAELLAGRHDFSAFALAGGSHGQPWRTIASAVWEESGEELRFRIVGDGFLRGMVRALVGTLLEVGLGKRSAAGFAELLQGGLRAAAGPTAAARGLTLEKVLYAREQWPVDGWAAADVVP
jgi:tRNA pseudouridine38-40 synthase